MSVIDVDGGLGTNATGDTLTLLFADIEGSTRLLDAQEQEYPAVVARARALMDAAIARYGGSGTPSQGDAFFATFTNADAGVRAAVEIQRAFHAESWPATTILRVRIGLHTGHARIVDKEYYGLDVHRAARISAAAAGGQVLLSASTRSLLGELPEGVSTRDLGAHRLKDIRYPEILFDLLIPDVPETAALSGPADGRPNNLPMPATSFVGRTRELREVTQLLQQPQTRLLTLTGPGGTGKTRLALEVARGLLHEFMHGLFFVQLAPIADPELLASTIGHVLGVPQFASKTPLETLTHHLAQRQVLLVLDNFEQIITAATTVQDLLRDCPRLKVLVTSREGLLVRSEHQYIVSPLELPQKDAQLPAIEETESVRLLLDRVHDYDRTFALTAENAGAISAICARLDGLPLALELAASQLKLRTPQSLLTDLQITLDTLVGGARDLPRHQRTLHDTIAWSHQLLSTTEQELFRRLSVFHGGASPESALSICADATARHVFLGLLTELTNKSLLTRQLLGGEIRVGMLEVIREFGLKELSASPEHEAVNERHARHYLAMAETMAPRLVSRDQRRFVTALLNEEDNLRAALTWGLQRRDADLTSRLLTALLWLWIPRGQFAEGRSWAARALETFADLGPCRERALMLETAGWLQVLGGNYPAALPLFEQSYDVFGRSSDPEDVLRSKITLGVTCLVLQDPRGPMLSDEALAMCSSIQNPRLSGLALLSAGAKHQFSGQDGEASACYEGSLQAFGASDDVFWPGQVLQNLAHLRLRAGDWKTAATLAAQALELGREYNYPMITNLSIAVMGAVSLTKGAADRAAQFFGAVDASLSTMGVTLEPPDQEAMTACVEAAQSSLGSGAYDANYQQGRGWSERDVLAAVSWLRASD